MVNKIQARILLEFMDYCKSKVGSALAPERMGMVLLQTASIRVSSMNWSLTVTIRILIFSKEILVAIGRSKNRLLAYKPYDIMVKDIDEFEYAWEDRI